MNWLNKTRSNGMLPTGNSVHQNRHMDSMCMGKDVVLANRKQSKSEHQYLHQTK